MEGTFCPFGNQILFLKSSNEVIASLLKVLSAIVVRFWYVSISLSHSARVETDDHPDQTPDRNVSLWGN